MGKIYVGQTALRIWFSTGSDLTGYTTTVANVLKPNGSTAIWTITVSDASTGACYYDPPTTATLDMAGLNWKAQPQIIFSDGTSVKGETAEFPVYDSFG